MTKILDALIARGVPEEQATSMIASHAKHGPNMMNYPLVQVAWRERIQLPTRPEDEPEA